MAYASPPDPMKNTTDPVQTQYATRFMSYLQGKDERVAVHMLSAVRIAQGEISGEGLHSVRHPRQQETSNRMEAKP